MIDINGANGPINDVSRLAGVSKATVSRVLSGSRGVKEASRQAVLKAMSRAEAVHQVLYGYNQCANVLKRVDK